MKLQFSCHECIKQGLVEPALAQVDPISIHESPVYEVTCSRGHTVKHEVHNPKFELLFESGVNALENGYYREAVSSFFTALEMFYVVSIRVMLQASGVDVKGEEFRNTWQHIKLSERQLGAFRALYLGFYKKAPLLLQSEFTKERNRKLADKTDAVEFRNKVIHAGLLPTYEQALAYGDGVGAYIRGLRRVMLDNPGLAIYNSAASDMSYDLRVQHGVYSGCQFNLFISRPTLGYVYASLRDRMKGILSPPNTPV
jgi:hypothetical protein